MGWHAEVMVQVPWWYATVYPLVLGFVFGLLWNPDDEARKMQFWNDVGTTPDPVVEDIKRKMRDRFARGK